MTDNFITKLYYMAIIFTFLPALVVFFVPHSYLYTFAGTFIWILLYALCFFSNKAKFLNFQKRIFKQRNVKIFMCFIAYITLTTIIHNFLGYSLVSWYRRFFYYFNTFCILVMVYLLPVTSLYLNISLKKIIRLLYIVAFVIYCIAIVQYIAFVLHINFLSNVVSLLTNLRFGLEYDEIEAMNIARVFSVFHEPNALAKYVFRYLPLFIVFANCKYKIFNNNFFNNFFKYMMVPLSLYILYLTKSPIYLIFCTIELILILLFIYRKIIIKHFAKVAVVFFLLVAISSFIFVDSSNTTTSSSKSNTTPYIERIQASLKSGTSLYLLTVAEPSLAARVISYVYYIETFKRNPVFGVGYYNSNSYINGIFYKVYIPKTPEILKSYLLNDYPIMCTAVLFTFLAEFGIIGTLLFYMFLFNNIIRLIKIKKYYSGILYYFTLGILFSIIGILCTTFYSSSLAEDNTWLLYGFALLLTTKPLIIKSLDKK